MRCTDRRRLSRHQAAMAAVRRERGRRLKERQDGTNLGSSAHKSAYWGLNVINVLISLARTSSSIDDDAKIDFMTLIYGLSTSSLIYSS